MEIRLTDSALVEDLTGFLWEHRILAVQTGDATLDVYDPAGDAETLERILAEWRESRAADFARV